MDEPEPVIAPPPENEEYHIQMDEPRPVLAPSPPEKVDAKADTDDVIKALESDYAKQLANVKREYEKRIKEIQDELASKDMNIIVLKVQLESVEQESKNAIDHVIAKTQKHMANEIEKYKKDHEKKVAKIISDAKEIFKKKSIENENKILQLRKEMESSTSKAEEVKREKNLEISKQKKEYEQLLLTLNEQIKTLESESEESQKVIRQLKTELELKEQEIPVTQNLEEKVIQFKRLLQEQESAFLHKLDQKVPSSLAIAESEEISKAQPVTKEKETSQQGMVDIQEILRKERARIQEIERGKLKELEREAKKKKKIIDQLMIEKKELRRELKQTKATAVSNQEEEHKQPKKGVTLLDIFGTILLIGANLIFLFVIYPNLVVSNWIESIGLNDLSFTVRILITLFGIIISLFYFVRARKASRRNESTGNKSKEGQSLTFPLGIIVMGVILLMIFLFQSYFIFFLFGTILIALAGLLIIIDSRKLLKEQKHA